jgi:hypothetical protein
MQGVSHRTSRDVGNERVFRPYARETARANESRSGICGKIRLLVRTKNIYVLKHPSIGEIPAPVKQRLGFSPNGSMTRKSR